MRNEDKFYSTSRLKTYKIFYLSFFRPHLNNIAPYFIAFLLFLQHDNEILLIMRKSFIQSFAFLWHLILCVSLTGLPATGLADDATVTTEVNMTTRLINPNFDNTTKGWTLSSNDSPQSKISTTEKGGGVIADAQNHWQLWKGNGTCIGKVFQKISGLPCGRYKVSAQVSASFNGTINLYANSGIQSITSGTANVYKAIGLVSDSTLELGLQFNASGSTTIDFDTFTLTYLGEDLEGYSDALHAKISEAEIILNNIDETITYNNAIALQKAIVEAKALSDSSGQKVIDAISLLSHAISRQEEMASEYTAFTTVLTAAKSELNINNYPGYDDFSKAIADAEQATHNADTTLSIITDNLNLAREQYYNSQYTVVPEQQTVSYVDLSLNGSEKYVLRVDGRPYYGTEIQVRPDKLRGYYGWTEDEIEAVFKQAADDGFSTLSVPLYWIEVEPTKNVFNWIMLDRYLNWCHKYGVKMELLWFSWSSGGRVQYLWNYGGKQQLRTPDYVCSMDGTSEYNVKRNTWEYSLDWQDTNLRDREALVLSKIMDHVALWDANNGNPHTVIGVQLGNEARSYGDNTATAAQIIDYYSHVGKAVKSSKYVVWTRLNCVSYETSDRTNANETLRSNGGTNIDFVGIDVYGTNASKVKGNLDSQLGENKKNFRMIMEIDAKDSNTPLYQMTALAGDKAFDYYNMGFVDGNGLYTNDANINNGHTLVERSQIGLVRQRNAILRKANQDIALKKQGSGLYVYNYTGTLTTAETGLSGITFTPTVATSQAIAIRHNDNEIALLVTSGGLFTFPESLSVETAQKGYYDETNQWISEGDVNFTTTSINMPITSCVRLYLKKPIQTDITTLKATDTDNTYYSLDGYRVMKPRKGVYILKGGKTLLK